MFEIEDNNWALRLERYPQAVLQQLRGLVLAGGVLLLAVFYPAMAQTQIALLITGLLLLAAFGTSLRWLERSKRSAVSIAAQLAIDGVLLALILAAVGGATNPVISYLLVPVALAALLLSSGRCFSVTLWFVGIYSALVFWHYPLPSLSPHGAQHGLNAHVIGMWLTFAVSALVLAWLLNAQVGLVRQARTELQRLREQQLRDENVLTVATLAAGAAHELATPLATLAIGLEELSADCQPQAQEIELLQAQVARCRQTLLELAQSARDHQAGERECASVARFIAELGQNLQLLQPQVQLQQRLSGEVGGQVLWPLTLKQALLNLLNNAARESDCIQLDCQWDRHQLQIGIRDFGPGMGEVASLPSYQLRASAQGLGMGLLLSHASIEQAGGSLHLLPAADGGTVATIRLPLLWESEA